MQQICNSFVQRLSAGHVKLHVTPFKGVYQMHLQANRNIFINIYVHVHMFEFSKYVYAIAASFYKHSAVRKTHSTYSVACCQVLYVCMLQITCMPLRALLLKCYICCYCCCWCYSCSCYSSRSCLFCCVVRLCCDSKSRSIYFYTPATLVLWQVAKRRTNKKKTIKINQKNLQSYK